MYMYVLLLQIVIHFVIALGLRSFLPASGAVRSGLD